MNKTVRRINFPYCRDCVFLSVMFIRWLLSHNTDTLNSRAGPHPALAAAAGEVWGQFGAGAGGASLKTLHPTPCTSLLPVLWNASQHPQRRHQLITWMSQRREAGVCRPSRILRGFPLQTGLCRADGSCSKASSLHSTPGHPELPLPRQLIALSVQSQL